MDIRESLTDGNMQINKTSILKNLKKVAKLAPVNEEVKPKASKSLTATIMENISASTEQAVKKPLDMSIKPKAPAPSPVKKQPLNLKEFFKDKMNKSLNENQRAAARERAMFGKGAGREGKKFSYTKHFFFPDDPYGNALS